MKLWSACENKYEEIVLNEHKNHDEYSEYLNHVIGRNPTGVASCFLIIWKKKMKANTGDRKSENEDEEQQKKI